MTLPDTQERHDSAAERFEAERFHCWLWPDKNIAKRESRKLREEHNALVNSHAATAEALRDVLGFYTLGDVDHLVCTKMGEASAYHATVNAARKAISEGGAT